MTTEATAAIVSAVLSGALVVTTAWIAIATLRGVRVRTRVQTHVQTFTE